MPCEVQKVIWECMCVRLHRTHVCSVFACVAQKKRAGGLGSYHSHMVAEHGSDPWLKEAAAEENEQVMRRQWWKKQRWLKKKKTVVALSRLAVKTKVARWTS